jgi:hypothetical protein
LSPLLAVMLKSSRKPLLADLAGLTIPDKMLTMIPKDSPTPAERSQRGLVQFGPASMSVDLNLLRLRLLMALFRLQAKDVCRSTRYSKGTVSLILAGKMKGSEEFFVRLNNAMPKMIAESGGASCIFDVPPTAVQVDGAAKQLLGV